MSYSPDLSHPPQRIYNDGERRTIIQAADQSVASSTTLEDSDLSLSILPNRNYGFEIRGVATIGAGGWKLALDVPSDVANQNGSLEIFDTSDDTILATVADAGAVAVGGAVSNAGENHILRLDGVIENGPSGGNVKLQFAQNSSNADGISLLRGARLTLWEIAK